MKVLHTALAGGMLLLMAGCASVQPQGPGSRGAGNAQKKVDLALCLFDSKSARMPAVTIRGETQIHMFAGDLDPFFQSVSVVSSKNDTQGCDLMGEVAQPTVFKPAYIDVYSAYSKKLLMRAVTQNYIRWRYEDPLYDAFNKEAPLYAHVVAERDGPMKREQGDASGAAGSVSKSDLQTLIKDALKESALAQKPPEPVARAPVASDIDRPVFADTQRALGEDDVAVVIGVEKYQDLPAADYAASDARLVKDYLVALGVKERNVQLLVDEKATQSSIKKTVETWLANRVKKESRVVVYYSGHGSPDPATGAAYIVPHDGDPNYLADTGYPLKNLYEKLGTLPAQEVVVLLDACFSGAGGRSVLAKGARPMVVTKEGGVLPPKMVVLAATQGAQISTSATEKGHGLFTYHLLKALKDGKKDIVEIYQHIQPLVEDEAKALNVQQSPSLNPEPRLAQVRFRLRN